MNGNPVIQLAHGGGGRMSRELIDREIVTRFGAGPLTGLPDGAALTMSATDVIFTTDSFVVSPIEFPGGNIGHLAVHGTVNDIAAAGGVPRWLSLALIIEEGLPIDSLRLVLDSVVESAAQCDVTVVTGDTKVVAAGQCDGIYINTAGIGEQLPGYRFDPTRIAKGDKVVVSGNVGDHGMAVLSAREGIDIGNGPISDTGPVHRLVMSIEDLLPKVHFMRDPTRGGLASVLNECVEKLPVGIDLLESAIPVSKGTRAVSEMLGLDILHVASEGRLLAICAPEIVDALLTSWQSTEEGKHATCVGTVTGEAGRVTLTTLIGGQRLVDVPRGELLPRIC